VVPSRHHDAAVLTADDPAANAAARVVPSRAALRKVGGVVVGYDHQPTRLPGRAPFERIRLSEIERIVKDRHSKGCDPIGASSYLVIAIPLVVALAKRARGDAEFITLPSPEQCVIGWARHYFPHLDEAFVMCLMARVPHASRLRADTVAAMLGVTDEERTRLRLRTVGARDVPKAERKARAAAKKRERERARSEAKRREAGAMPREAYEAGSQSAEAARMGISRWTLRRLKRKSNATACAAAPDPHKSVAREDHLSFFTGNGPVRPPSDAFAATRSKAMEDAE
jgi:hypothetical protein